MHSSKDKSTKTYNRSSHELLPLIDGENIRFQQDSNFWKPGNIVSRLNEHSYVVRAQTDTIFRCNRRHILRSNEKSQNLSEPELILNAKDPILLPTPAPHTPAKDIVQLQ
jgi:hypothetical protein